MEDSELWCSLYQILSWFYEEVWPYSGRSLRCHVLVSCICINHLWVLHLIGDTCSLQISSSRTGLESWKLIFETYFETEWSAVFILKGKLGSESQQISPSRAEYGGTRTWAVMSYCSNTSSQTLYWQPEQILFVSLGSLYLTTKEDLDSFSLSCKVLGIRWSTIAFISREVQM